VTPLYVYVGLVWSGWGPAEAALVRQGEALLALDGE
jgi:hypothetical protein